MSITAGELAEKFDLELRGDAAYLIEGICSLRNGRANHLSFLGDKRYAKYLAETRAGAIIVDAERADACPGLALIASNPALAFARVASEFAHVESFSAGIHPAAVVDESATVDATASVGPNATVGRNAVIEAGAVIGPGCVIGDAVRIGKHCRLEANVTVIGRSQLGERVCVLPSSVIGGRGFGLVPDEDRNWLPVPQLGRVVIGDDVEIGACVTIDRGAIDDTVIGNGCKFDDHIHLGHNVQVGEHTVVAGWSAVAGSTSIGSRCLIAGGVGIADNLRICDGVMVTGMTMVSGNIDKPGVYSSGWGAIPRKQWVKILHASRSMADVDDRLERLEQATGLTEPGATEENGESDD